MPRPVRKAIEGAGLMGSSVNRITLVRDANGGGKPEVHETFLAGLNQPFGMVLRGDWLYVANTDALVRFPYREGQTKITVKGEKVLDLPAGGYNNHWTRNVVASPDGSKLYVSVGSQTNVDEEGLDAKEPRQLQCSTRPRPRCAAGGSQLLSPMGPSGRSPNPAVLPRGDHPIKSEYSSVTSLEVGNMEKNKNHLTFLSKAVLPCTFL